ncbi:MAG: metallophosphoesterase, partial [Deltaproteobacteria bacterium]
TPARSADDFFFIQITDVHAYPEAADFGALPGLIPGWIPDRMAAWATLRAMQKAYAPRTRDDIVAVLRDALGPERDVARARPTTVFLRYFDAFLEPGSALGRVGPAVRGALAEVASLAPSFVISTGDLVLEGNQGEPEAIDRWFRFYRDETRALGIPFYETIGNNEIAGDRNDAFAPDDPRYGKYFFEKYHGPTHFSFDRGPFHFAALDTHRPEPRAGEPKRWVYERMESAVRDWLDADLAAHPDRVLVVLNHEPFHIDPSWTERIGDDAEPADDEGLLARHRVAYAIAGHVHWNGFEERDGTTHITTGALSGFRWALPAELHPRGYRLFYAKDGRLYSAWKEIGKPVVGFVDPVGRERSPLFPGSKAPAAAERLTAPVDVVAVAADADGAFAAGSLTLDGEPLEVEPWGRYFLHARLDAADLGSGERILALTAKSADGRVYRATLALRVAPGAAE